MVVKSFKGQHESALAAGRESLKLDPSSPFRFFPALSLIELGRTEDAVRLLEPISKSVDEGIFNRLGSAWYHALRGELEEAGSTITTQVIRHAKPDAQYCWFLAQIYATIGETDSALEWMERAVDNQFWNHRFLSEHERVFDPLRHEPRFAALIDRAREGRKTLETTDWIEGHGSSASSRLAPS